MARFLWSCFHNVKMSITNSLQSKDEKAILSNKYGSDRYMKFIQSLGTLFRLKDCDPKRVYLGGLDVKGNDGEFSYGWQDESTQCKFGFFCLYVFDRYDLSKNRSSNNGPVLFLPNLH